MRRRFLQKATKTRGPRFETLEPRHLLNGNPTVLAHDPDGLTHDPVSTITLELSEPVVGDDARDAGNYDLLHLGADRAVGGGDDQAIRILPKYLDGTTQIEISTVTDLSAWSEVDYAFPPGILGDWEVDPDGTSVTQHRNGGTTFFVSDFDLIGGQFVGRMVVEDAGGDDDYIGMTFGFQQHPETGKPDDYYLLSWKQAEQGVAEQGLKLAKVTGTGSLLNPPDLWDLESSDPYIEILAQGPAVGWQEQTEYDFLVDYQSDGAIELSIQEATGGQVVWDLDYTDPAPLGGGKVGFYNFSQAGVRYTNLEYLTPLADGYYQLTARSGNPGLRDLEQNFLDGDGDGTGGDDFVTIFGIDTYAPSITVALQPASDSAAADNVTNVTSPTFDVTVNKIGRIELDFDGDETVDASQFVSGPGTYPFATSYPADATYTVTADFAAASGDPAQDVLEVTIDTQAPELLPGPVEADAPWSAYDLSFNEPIDAATFDTEDVAFSDHAGDPVPVDAVTGSGADYTVSFPYQVVAGNYTLLIGPAITDVAGNPMSAAVEIIVGLNPDEFGPEVMQVGIEPDAITVVYFDGGGMDGETVIDSSNYTLLASGGDGTFDDPNDVNLSSQIGVISFEEPIGEATLPLLSPLADEKYRLTINATTPGRVQDLAGNPLDDGVDHVEVLELDTQPASVVIELAAASDSGIPGDNVTSATEPVFDVTVNEAGLIEVDLDGDDTPDESELAAGAGTYSFTTGPLDDGQLTVTATFTPAVGNQAGDALAVTIDTEAPVLLPGAAEEQAPAYGRTITFSEALAAGAVGTGNVTVSGPEVVTVVGVSGSGDTYTVQFDPIVTPGGYTVEVTNLEDPAGNPTATTSHTFTLLEDITPPQVIAFSPLGFRNSDVSQLLVEFGEAVAAASFETTDVAIGGPGGPIDPSSFVVTPLDDRTFEVTIAALSAEGQYTVAIGPGVTDLAGNPMAGGYQASFTIDKTAPVLTGVWPSGEVSLIVDHMDLTFDEPIKASTLAAADIALSDPDGSPVPVTEVESVGGNTYRASFAEQRANGTFNFTVGPDIEDRAGNPMAEALAGDFTISLPDLWLDPSDPDSLDVPDPALFGETITVQWKVDNAGQAGASQLIDRIWFSPDDTLDETDLWLADEPRTAEVAAGGEYQRSRQVTLPLDQALSEGTYHIFVETDADGTVVESDEANNALGRSLEVSFPPLPDLTPSEIIAPSLAQPGTQIELSWTVTNQGTQAAEGPWTEAVYLSGDEVIGDDLLVALFSYEGPFDSADPPVVRTETITIPVIGVSGELRFVVRTDAGEDLFEQNEDNNAAIDDLPISVPSALTLTVSVTEVSEDAPNPAIRAVVTRNGDLSDPLLVTLTSHDTTELTVPPSVTIPAGKTSATFDINVVHDGIVDGPQTVTIEVQAADAVPDVAGVVVTDVDLPSVFLDFDVEEVTEGDTVSGTVSRDLVTGDPLHVVLLSSDSRLLAVPMDVEIPADQASVAFEATAVDDALLKTTLVASVEARAMGYISGVGAITIIDNDDPGLTLVLGTDSISEGAGGGAATATVTRDLVGGTALVVDLSSSDVTEALVPRAVTIPAGQSSSTFFISAVDDTDFDGTQTVTITARPTCYLGMPLDEGRAEASLEVTDDDGPTLRLVIDKDLVAEGLIGATAVTVSRNTDTTSALEVTLESSNTDELTVPETVTIPADHSSYTFEVDTHEDGVPDGNQTVTVTGSAAGFVSGSDSVIVTDIDLPDLVVDYLDAPETVPTEEYFDLTYRVANEGLSEAVGSNADDGFPGSWQQRVFLSDDPIIGDDTLMATFEFVGTLPADLFFERTVPLRAPRQPGDYWIVVTTDLGNTVAEGIETNNTRIADQSMHVEVAYAATVQTDVDVAFTGDPVPLYGTALKSGSGLPAQFELVNIHLNVRGTKRIIAALTNEYGEFSAIFTPLPGEGGHYTIGAAHPGQQTAPVQDDFVLLGMRAEPPQPTVTVAEGSSESGQVTIRNLSEVALTGLSVEVLDDPDNLDVLATLTGGDSLAGLGTLPLDYQVTATDASVTEATVILRLTSAEGASLDVPVEVTVRELRSRLTTDAAPLRAAMLRGQQRMVEFKITNQGGAPTGDIQVEIPQLPWLSVATPQPMPSLGPGQSALVTLLLTPAEDLPLDEYTGNLYLRTDDGGLSVPFALRAVSEGRGDLSVTVVDEYFYFTEEAPRVENATVTLRDAISGDEVGAGVTDSQGGFSLTEIQEGYYNLEVRADGHERYKELVLIEAGQLNHELVFISRQTVQYVWTVEETEIEDRYKINVETVFETNVPIPVVTVDPPLIDLASMRQPGQTMQVDLTITNHGLIAAQGALLDFGSHPLYEITPLIRDVGLLPAKSSLTVPLLIERLAPPALPEDGEAGASAEQSSSSQQCEIRGALRWAYPCGEKDVSKKSDIKMTNAEDDCTAGPGAPGGWIVDGGAGGGGGNLHVNEIKNECECKERWLYKEDLSSYLSPPVKAVELAINAAIGATMTWVSLTVEAEGGVKLCCDERFGAGLEFAGSGTVGAKLSVGPGFSVGLSGGIDLPDGGKISLSGEGFVGIEASLGASIQGLVTSGCNFSDPRVVSTGSVTVGFQAGIRGKISAKKEGPLLPTEYDLVGISGGLFGSVTASEVYSTSTGLKTCLKSEGVYLEAYVSAFGYQYSPYDDPNTPQFETKKYLIDAVDETCDPAEGGTFGGSDLATLEQSIAEMLRTEFAQLGMFSPTCSQTSIVASPDPLELPPPVIDQPSQTFTAAGDCGCGNSTTLPEDTLQGQADDEGCALASFSEQGVCARVRVSVDQEAVMTRTAFEAGLELTNNSPDDPLEEIKVELHVLDEDSKIVDDLFGVREPTLTNLAAVDGSGTLGTEQTGSASWIIIPTDEAAPDAPRQYSIGGMLSYMQGGYRVNVPLESIPITVWPDAALDVTYFHERDVFADDPWTEETEPSQPFALAVMIENHGAGEARDLTITAAQPEIVDNEKGLLIDFDIIATQVAGENLTPSLTADFGNLAPGEIKIGQWLLKSTVQGQFIEYNATFEHLDGMGDPRLSLIKNLEIHELIHSVRADGPFEDGLPDFLTNDVPDPDDLPDTLYLSDGSVESVGLGTDGSTDGEVTNDDLVVQLTVDMAEGWSYLRMPDPGGSEYRLVNVERSDGSDLPVENFWQTDRTFIEMGRPPRYEDNLHLFDASQAGGIETYTLLYQPRDQIGPVVIDLEQPGDEPLVDPVASLEVTFNEEIRQASFGWEDLELTRNEGPNLIHAGAGVAIQRLDATTYRIDGLAALTQDDGEYAFTVDATGVSDLFANPGTGTRSAQWIKVADVPGVAAIDGVPSPFRNSPLVSVDVTFTKPINPGTLTAADLSLTLRDGPNLLDPDPGLTFTQTDVNTFHIESFAGLTAAEGLYRLTVDAGGVEDPQGEAGLGQRTVSWTMDTTPPTADSMTAIEGAATNAAVDDVTVEFSEVINLAFFDFTDLTLTHDGMPVTLTAAVLVEHVEDSVYQIVGLGPLTGVDGDYLLSVDATGIEDLAGNPGEGSASTGWLMDTVAPGPATNLAISPDTGASSSDGRTNTLTVTITGDLSDPDVTVELFDTTTSRNLGPAVVTDTSFSLGVTLAAGGAHRVRARVSDAAGNYADTFLDVFVDLTHPMLMEVDAPSQLAGDPTDVIEVTFSESMNVQPMIDGGSILDAVSLVHLANGPIVLTADLFAYDDPARTLTLSLNPIAESLLLGAYELRLAGSELADQAGNLLRGGSGGTAAFDFPGFDPAETVQAGGAEIQVDAYSVPALADWNSDGAPDLIVGEKVLENDAGKVRVYLNTGTATIPVFDGFFYAQSGGGELTVSAGGCLGVFPRVFDWNQDGKKDLVAGLADGTVQVFLNENTDAEPEFGLPSNVQVGQPGDKVDIAVGGRATPDVVDWNNDGRYDLVLGALDGKVRVFLNEGPSGPADFRSGTVILDGPSDLVVPSLRSSVVVTDLNADGRKDLVLGNTDGQLLFYANTGTDAAPLFDGFEPLRAGGTIIDLAGTPRSRPFVGDFNDDRIPDILVGALDGLVRLYIGQSQPANGEMPNINDGEPGGVYVYTFQIPGPPNDPPIAAPDGYRTDENAELSTAAPGVLENDTDANEDQLSALLVQTSPHGTLSLNLDGSFNYLPQADFHGIDAFVYKASDGRDYSAVVTVEITVGRPYYWDGQGDGNWGDIDDETDLSRWIDVDGIQLSELPGPSIDAEVQIDRVTVATDRQVRDLRIRSGALAVLDDATVGLAGEFRMYQQAEYACQLGSSTNGLIAAAGDVLLKPGSTLSLQATGGLGAAGNKTRTIITAAGTTGVTGAFTNEPTPGEHLGSGVFYQGVTYPGAPGMVTSVQVEVLQAGPGDLDGDGDVDLDDLSLLDDGWDPTATDKIWTDGDVDGDRDVDLDDLSLLDDAWDPAGGGSSFFDAPEVAGSDQKLGHAAVVEKVFEQPSDSRETSLGNRAWPYELEQTNEKVFEQPPDSRETSLGNRTWPYEFEQTNEKVFEQPSDSRETSLGKWTWLYEFEQTNTKSRPSEKHNPAKEAVDKLLATWWP